MQRISQLGSSVREFRSRLPAYLSRYILIKSGKGGAGGVGCKGSRNEKRTLARASAGDSFHWGRKKPALLLLREWVRADYGFQYKDSSLNLFYAKPSSLGLKLEWVYVWVRWKFNTELLDPGSFLLLRVISFRHWIFICRGRRKSLAGDVSFNSEHGSLEKLGTWIKIDIVIGGYSKGLI